ncbi:putative wall-associated receptor kinase-like 16 [Castanea sativa]|uniref:putative wall-associated receptor kinase-like 16 n=1 Tax=Castanea sativa TaxID=21020 RepID=UPI003F64BF9F
MLVFELISNGTLFDHLHGQCNEIPCRISWPDHVRIATKISYALCYIDYGNSIDGTIGYIYPVYLETLRVTEKCDVYGFGVELVEVLTGHHPIEMFPGHKNLVDCFVLSMEENCILQIVDDVVLSQGSNEDIQAFIELALRCIKKKGDERPTMREVTLELRRRQHLIWSK